MESNQNNLCLAIQELVVSGVLPVSLYFVKETDLVLGIGYMSCIKFNSKYHQKKLPESNSCLLIAKIYEIF